MLRAAFAGERSSRQTRPSLSQASSQETNDVLRVRGAWGAAYRDFRDRCEASLAVGERVSGFSDTLERVFSDMIGVKYEIGGR